MDSELTTAVERWFKDEQQKGVAPIDSVQALADAMGRGMAMIATAAHEDQDAKGKLFAGIAQMAIVSALQPEARP